MILSVSNVSKSFLEVPVLSDISFQIEEHEKAALIGINGAGKTTLLRIIMNELEKDDGSVVFAKDSTVGYLAQKQNVEGQNTIYEELLLAKERVISMEKELRLLEDRMNREEGEALSQIISKYTSLQEVFEKEGGLTYKSEINGILKGLGFSEDEFDKKIETLSGGGKTRVALGKLLAGNPDLIILDEPTNHLDIGSIRWLENYLSNYNKAVLVVSHDRYFLDKVAAKIIEIERTRSAVYKGNYTDYAAKKEIVRTQMRKAYENQQREIAHQQEVIDKLKSFNREKSIKRAESREKMLDKIEVLDKPTEERTDMKLKLEPDVLSGNDVLGISALSKAFDEKLLFEDLSFDIKRGEKVAIIGDNGTGKTTILKIINGIVEADKGEVKTGANVNIGYYDQEHHVLHDEKTLFDEISDAYPDLTNTKVRNTLAAFLFTGEDVYKRIKDLSGGEKGRVSLAKLMLSKSNFLILDEPTNHLDIASKEILEDAINAYTGTALYVSHDRYFVNRTATRILELEGGKLTSYLGNYDYYLEKKESAEAYSINSNKASGPAPKESKGSDDWNKAKENQAILRKKANDLKKCEEQISVLENKRNELENEMADPKYATNAHKLTEFATQIEEIDAKLSELMEKWEELAD